MNVDVNALILLRKDEVCIPRRALERKKENYTIYTGRSSRQKSR